MYECYHVCYHVSGGKKSYNVCECHFEESKAKKRALELSVATNITYVAIEKIQAKFLSRDLYKGTEYVKEY